MAGNIYILWVRIGNVKESDRFNAGDKAPRDMVCAAKGAGVRPIVMRRHTTKNHFCNAVMDSFRVLWLCAKLLFTIRKGDIFVNQCRMSLWKSKYIYSVVHARGGKVVFLIHDLNFLRYHKDKGPDDKYNRREVEYLDLADVVVAHTPAMEQALRERGVAKPIYNLYLFDYCTDGSELQRPLQGAQDEVVFAGNLMKSKFLEPLNDTQIEGVKYNLYGFHKPDYMDNPNLRYSGRFSPEHVCDISGGWGLVWDGSSVDTCDGLLGEYLSYNSSHKISLYLVVGLPLIVWSGSSLREYVAKHNIGIAVDSLSQIRSSIDAIPEQEYARMKENARAFGDKLRSGGMFADVIRQIEKEI